MTTCAGRRLPAPRFLIFVSPPTKPGPNWPIGTAKPSKKCLALPPASPKPAPYFLDRPFAQSVTNPLGVVRHALGLYPLEDAAPLPPLSSNCLPKHNLQLCDVV